MSTNKLRFSKRKVKEAGAAYLFIAPMLIGLLIFYFFAFIQNIYFSFNKVGAFGPPTFIGWENYIRLVNDPLFWTALKNTLFYTVLGVPLVVGFSVVIAWLLNFPINQILYNMTELENVANLQLIHAVLLVAVSTVLTMLGGHIPARMASKRDAVEALRSE